MRSGRTCATSQIEPEAKIQGEVSSMRERQVLAVCVSDLHLSETPPVARSAEKDWLEVQAEYLAQLRTIARTYKAPIVCAGDIFDRWNAGPGIINLALKSLPHMYAIPGQHDLPNHRYADITRSAYHTLCLSGLIENLTTLPLTISPGLTLHGFAWNEPLTKREEAEKGTLHLAVCHRYVWAGHCHPGAREEDHANVLRATLHRYGYDAGVFGDNHSGFISDDSVVPICNCGTFLRRKMDERRYRPCVSLYWSDNTFERIPLDCSKDVFLDMPEELKGSMSENNYAAFIAELHTLGDAGLDFLEYLKRCLPSLSEGGRQVVLKIMESVRGETKQ